MQQYPPQQHPQQPPGEPVTFWTQWQALTEYFLGHPETPEEKLGKIKVRLEEVRREARRAMNTCEYRRKDAVKRQQKAAREGNAVDLKREARNEVMSDREYARLSARLQRIEMTLRQVQEAHGDGVLAQAQVEMMQAVLQLTPQDTGQVARLCFAYQRQRMQGQQVQEQMNEMLEEAYEEVDEAQELGVEEEARVEEIVRLQSDLVAQQQTAQMPRAPHTHIAQPLLNEADQRRANREDAREMERFLARK